MPAKSVYSIPAALDRSFLDQEVALTGNMPPISLKTILSWVVSVLLLAWISTSTWISESGPFLIFLVVVWWIAASAFFLKYNATKELNLMTVPALLSYVPRSSREVVTRSTSKPAPFYSITLLEGIDESGFIRYADNTVGQVYLVVGSASILLFEEDKAAMLDRVDKYWRKVDSTVEHIFVTTKEPQRIWRQMASLERRNQALTHRDPELFALMDEQYDILKNHVGGSFNSIHQYLVLKADNLEALRKAHSVLQNEVNDSSLMFKECSTLNRADAHEMLRTIYRAPI